MEFESVYRSYRSAVRRRLLRYGVPERDVADATHDVFLIVHRKLSGFRGESDLGTWVTGICRRAAADYRRSARARYEVFDDGPLDGAVHDERPDTALMLLERKAAVHGALASSDAALVTVNVEDLWAERTPVNVPGTVEGNWARKAARSVEQLRDDDRLQQSLRVLEERRPLVVRGPSRSVTSSTAPTSDGRERFSDLDLHLFAEGRHHRLYNLLGSHPVRDAGGVG